MGGKVVCLWKVKDKVVDPTEWNWWKHVWKWKWGLVMKERAKILIRNQCYLDC